VSGRARLRPPVVLARARGVATIVLARGPAGHALDEATLGALAEVAGEVRHDDDVRAVVLAAEGRDFSVGRAPSVAAEAADEAIEAMAAIEQPVVCAAQGRVEGLGLALALAADLVVADTTVRVSAGDPASARLAGGGLVQRLVRVVGPARATAMLLLGTRLGAREALRSGLVQRVVTAGSARRAALGVARGMARRGPLALRYAKEACRRASDLPLDQGMRLEHDLYVLLQTTADRREGVEAFREHRAPRFTGR
jgi:enoyl-CoA hydratase/carnithine racemase